MVPEDIEDVCEWKGASGAFVAALTDLRLLDIEGGSYLVHDWAAAQPWVCGRQARNEKATKAAQARWQKQARKSEADTLRAERLEAARARGTHTAEEWKAMIWVCGGVCARCGQERPLQKDHIVPLHQPDSSDSIGNLQPLCSACHGIKAGDVLDFRPPDWEPLLRPEMLRACS